MVFPVLGINGLGESPETGEGGQLVVVNHIIFDMFHESIVSPQHVRLWVSQQQRSWYVPSSVTTPFSMTCRRCAACVTRMNVLSTSVPRIKHCSCVFPHKRVDGAGWIV